MSDILTSRIINVQFGIHDQKTYAYFTEDETIQKGDLVVVVTPQDRAEGFPVFAQPKANEAPAAIEPGTDQVANPAPPAPAWGAPPVPVWDRMPAAPMAPSLMGYAKIARVVSTEVTVESVERVREWVVAKLDFTNYGDRREREEKRKVLAARIKRARQEAIEQIEMDELANKSPALKSLLEEMAKL